jgi:uncharacterized protein with ParB-like and HNH nuclease domain
MKDQRLQIADIVRHIDDAMLNKLDVPEFQRKYVWGASKVADLVDSLWRGYPIGTLLLWESSYESPRTALGAQGSKLWIESMRYSWRFSLTNGSKLTTCLHLYNVHNCT